MAFTIKLHEGRSQSALKVGGAEAPFGVTSVSQVA